MTQLTEPDRAFEAGYRTMLADFGSEPLVPYSLCFPCDDFNQLITTLEAHSKGIGVSKGFVANSNFWLVEGSDLIGVSNLRHELTDSLHLLGGHIGFGIRPSRRGRGHAKELLRLTLEKAKQRGIERALLTCNKGNLASAGVISANGGVLESEAYMEAQNDVVQRYWITLIE